METPLAIEGFEPGTPLKEALGFLAERYDFNILMDVDAFQLEQHVPEPENQKIHLPRTRGTVRSVLTAILRQARATYRIHDTLVLIMPMQPMEKAALRKLTDGLKRPQTRIAAAEALVESDHCVKNALPDLLRALRAEQGRPAAVLDQARFERLVADLDSDEFPTRQAAARALKDQPERALRRILATRVLPLDHRRRLEEVVGEQAGARARLVWALAEIAHREPQSIGGVLMALVNEEDLETRRQAHRFLQRAELDEPKRLLWLLESKDERVRAGAVAALGLVYENLPPVDLAEKADFGFFFSPVRYEIADSLKQALRDPSPQVREVAAATLKRLEIKAD